MRKQKQIAYPHKCLQLEEKVIPTVTYIVNPSGVKVPVRFECERVYECAVSSPSEDGLGYDLNWENCPAFSMYMAGCGACGR